MARTLIQEGCTLIQKGYRMLENDTRAQGVLHHDPYQGHGPYFDPTGLAVIQKGYRIVIQKDYKGQMSVRSCSKTGAWHVRRSKRIVI